MWTGCVVASFVVLAAAQQSQRSDTIVIAASTAQHASVGRLVQQFEIGATAATPQTTFGSLADATLDQRGSIFVVDYSGAVRKFDSTGKFVRDFGRTGDGPGEYRRPVSIAVSSSGHVAVASVLDNRVLVYDSTGRALVTKHVASLTPALATSMALRPYLIIDPQQRLWVPVSLRVPGWTRTAFDKSAPQSYIRMRLDGAVIDTVREPANNYVPPLLTIPSKPDHVAQVPFTPKYSSALSPLGYFVTGTGAAQRGVYAVQLHQPPVAASEKTVWRDGDPIRALRVPYTAVPVLPGERQAWQATTTAVMSWYQRGWRWNGSPIPATKPAYSSFWPDTDGRLWVKVHDTAVEDRSVRNSPEIGPGGMPDHTWPEQRWRQTQLMDIVGSDGRYLGRVQLDERLLLVAARGDQVVAISLADYTNVILKKFRVVWAK